MLNDFFAGAQNIGPCCGSFCCPFYNRLVQPTTNHSLMARSALAAQSTALAGLLISIDQALFAVVGILPGLFQELTRRTQVSILPRIIMKPLLREDRLASFS